MHFNVVFFPHYMFRTISIIHADCRDQRCAKLLVIAACLRKREQNSIKILEEGKKKA